MAITWTNTKVDSPVESLKKKSRGRFASKKIIEVNSFLGPGRFALSLVRLKLYGSLLATEAP